METTTASADAWQVPCPPIVSLADALTAARARAVMPPAQLAEAASAVRLLQKVTGLDPDHLPAAPADLTPIIASAFPARYRISPKRWQNAVSAIRGLLRDCGLHAPPMKGMPVSPAWAALIALLSRKHHRIVLLGFARWCTDAGFEPGDLTEQVLERYDEFRRTETIVVHRAQLVSTIRIIWNRAVRAGLPGWPTRRLTAPRNPTVEALPLERFPQSFQTDLATYLAKRTEPDAFDADHACWRPATTREVRNFLIRAASLIAPRIGGVEHAKSLGDIVTVDAVEFILRHMFERAGNVWRQHAATCATYLLRLARDYVKADAATVARIEELRDLINKRVREHQKPGLSERVSQQIMPFDDVRILRRLFKLPGDLYRMARAQLADQPVRAAQLHEQGVMLDLLQREPMRRYNLASINYLEDFKRDERGRIVRLWISGERTKNGVAIDAPIDLEMAKRLHTHWTAYRPHIRGAASPWLFPSPKGMPRAPNNVTKTLGRAVTRLLGVKYTPHMTRHIVATVLYRKSAHNGVVVQRKLRHTSLKTTERMYGLMSNAGANAEWQAELEKFRRRTISVSQGSSHRGQRRSGR